MLCFLEALCLPTSCLPPPMRYAYICSANFAVDEVISQFGQSDKLQLPFICWLVLCFLYVCQQFHKFLVIQEKVLNFQQKKALKLQLTHACKYVCSSQQAAVVYYLFEEAWKKCSCSLYQSNLRGKPPPPLLKNNLLQARQHKPLWQHGYATYYLLSMFSVQLRRCEISIYLQKFTNQ